MSRWKHLLVTLGSVALLFAAVIWLEPRASGPEGRGVPRRVPPAKRKTAAKPGRSRLGLSKEADRERIAREEALRSACEAIKKPGAGPSSGFDEALGKAIEMDPPTALAILREARLPGNDAVLWNRMLPLLARAPSWETLEFMASQTSVRLQSAADGETIRYASELAEQLASHGPIAEPTPALRDFRRWMAVHPEESLRSRGLAAAFCFAADSERQQVTEELLGLLEREPSGLALIGVGNAFRSVSLAGQDGLAERAARILQGSDNDFQRGAALEALGATRSAAVEPAIRKILNSEEDPLFAAALNQAGRLKIEGLVPVIEAVVVRALAREGAAAIVGTGLAALGEHDSPEAAGALLRLLDQPLSVGDRDRALKHLDGSAHLEGNTEIASRLIGLAQSRDWAMSNPDLMSALAQTGTPLAADFLAGRYASAQSPEERFQVGAILLHLPPEHSSAFIRREFPRMEGAPYYGEVVDRLVRDLEVQGTSLKLLYSSSNAPSLSFASREKIIRRLGDLGGDAGVAFLREVSGFETDPALKSLAESLLKKR